MKLLLLTVYCSCVITVFSEPFSAKEVNLETECARLSTITSHFESRDIMATQSPSALAAVVIGATGATGKCLVQTLLTAKVLRITFL